MVHPVASMFVGTMPAGTMSVGTMSEVFAFDGA